MKSNIIATIAFACLPVMGFSQTPPEVWLCDRSEAFMYDGDFASTEFEDRGQEYFRPETREMFFWGGVWGNMCARFNNTYQVVLTDDGCNFIKVDEDGIASGLVTVDLDSQEITESRNFFRGKRWGVSVVNYTNCKVVSPLLFE